MKGEAPSGMTLQQKINKILNENRDFLEELLKTQLAEGRDRYDKPVTITDEDGERTFYKYRTILRKGREGTGLGAHIAWITNYMSGSFYSSIEARVYGTKFSFSSDVPYYDKIVFRSGDKIMHLSDSSMKILMEEIIRPQLMAMNNV